MSLGGDVAELAVAVIDFVLVALVLHSIVRADNGPRPRHGRGGGRGDEPRDPAEPEGGVLPEDLDVTAYVGPYQFPDIRRRRIAVTLPDRVA